MTRYGSILNLTMFTRVLVGPIGLDMGGVGGTNPPSPNKFFIFCFYPILFFKNRAFWCGSMCGRYRGKVVLVLPPYYLRKVAGRSQNYS